MSKYERVALGSLVNEYSERNRALACTDVYSVTNSEGFTPSTDYFSKEVFSKNISSYKVVRRGMFAYNPSRVNVGSISWLNCKDTVVISPMYVVFKIDEASLLQSYLDYFLHSGFGIAQIHGLTSGSVRDTLKYSALEQIKIPLPSREIQQQITAVLDRTKALIIARREQIAVLDKLAKDLFVEMFGDPAQNTMSWDIVSFSECVSKIENGDSPKCLQREAEHNEKGVLKLSAVTKGIYREYENKAAPHIELDSNNEIKQGDLLMTRKNTQELVGMCTYVFATRSKLFLPDIVFRLCTTKKINKLFLWQLMNFPAFRPNVRLLAHGAAASMPNISKSKLMTLPIICPPIATQESYGDCLLQINTQQSRLTASLAELETLYQSLTERAFAGELFG